jgi:3-dehydroquinate dehydratase-2
MHIHIINGPNLNLLGLREPEIYGTETFEDFLSKLKSQFSEIQLTYFQSNVEGEIINNIQENGFNCDGIILNAGGYTHTSVAIGDCVAAIKTPVIEVHISNIYARESFRHQSYIAPNAVGSIVGLGLNGYTLAITYFIQ